MSGPAPVKALTMEDRIRRAIRSTYNIIGTDMGWDEMEEKSSIVREVVADSNYLEQFGRDAEAVKAFRAMRVGERQAIMLKAFP